VRHAAIAQGRRDADARVQHAGHRCGRCRTLPRQLGALTPSGGAWSKSENPWVCGASRSSGVRRRRYRTMTRAIVTRK
jgi:hypothetical protein